ncbi:hypothetical protein TNCT_615671 [Trichonephila clavata]|uniref:Uncharacterized protein n=1 Tax=Trichonephila clavata TaxID=2740835 RepID=A0A8X6FMT6_TRICU|nr:hypothetical protein TNCT_615671 [Trichonephila clavata]
METFHIIHNCAQLYILKNRDPAFEKKRTKGQLTEVSRKRRTSKKVLNLNPQYYHGRTFNPPPPIKAEDPNWKFEEEQLFPQMAKMGMGTHLADGIRTSSNDPFARGEPFPSLT